MPPSPRFHIHLLHVPLVFAVCTFVLLFSSAHTKQQRVRDDTQCNPVQDESSCVCQLDSGLYISLLGIANENMDPSLEAMDSQNFKYSLNPCYGLNLKVPTGSCNTDDGMTGCQQTEDKVSAWGLGTLASETIFINTDGKVYIEYTGGQDNRRSQINLICSNTTEANAFTAEGDSATPLEYIFDLTSKEVCPSAEIKRKSQASSGGNVVGPIGIGLIFGALFVLALYFIVGILLNKFAFKKAGTDIVPQKALWLGLPFLIKDGVLLTFKPVIRTVKKDYEPLA